MKITAVSLLAFLASDVNAFVSPNLQARNAIVMSASEVAESEVESKAESKENVPFPNNIGAASFDLYQKMNTPQMKSKKPADIPFTDLKGNPIRTLPDNVKGMAGITGPLGFWDPLFLSKGKSAETMNLYREAELAHGRTAMLGAAGIIVGENLGHTTALAMVPKTPISFWILLVTLCGAIDIGRGKLISKKAPGIKDSYFDWDYEQEFPGDLDFDYLRARPADEKTYMDIRNYELNNGRLAMLGVVGTLAQESISGLPTFGVNPAEQGIANAFLGALVFSQIRIKAQLDAAQPRTDTWKVETD